MLAVLLAAGCGGGRTEKRVRWSLTAEPAGAALEVQAVFGGSSCSEFKDWDVKETDEEVDIRASALFEDGDCTADEVYEPHAVTLDAPLGDRRLVGCDPGDDDADCTQVAPVP